MKMIITRKLTYTQLKLIEFKYKNMRLEYETNFITLNEIKIRVYLL